MQTYTANSTIYSCFQKFIQISSTDPYFWKALQAIATNKAPASHDFPSIQPSKYVQKPKDVNIFGFEESFIKWINIFYNSPAASVITNVKISQPFKLNHGTLSTVINTVY